MKEVLIGKKIVIFGVGDIGQNLLQRLSHYATCEILCFCDNNPCKQGGQERGKYILSPQEAVDRYADAYFVITVINHTVAVTEQLLDMGVPQEQIIIFSGNDYIDEWDKKRQKKKETEYAEWCRKYNNRIKNLKGAFQGKRCFILGNGGSLTEKDLEKLTGEYTFGCNRLYKMYDRLSWRPVFYCFYDVQRVRKIKKDMTYILENCEYLFTSSTIKDELDEAVIENPKTYFVHMQKDRYYPQLPRFSENVDQQVYDGQTVLYMATQIAVYLGFHEIYYLGADNHYSVELNRDGTIRRDSEMKDYPDGMGEIELESSVIPQIELTTMSFGAVKKYADAHGIRVFNATRGGKLDVFDRVDFDSLF